MVFYGINCLMSKFISTHTNYNPVGKLKLSLIISFILNISTNYNIKLSVNLASLVETIVLASLQN